MKARITWRGWPGHFICGYRCVFHLNTLIEYDEIRIVVSTVGLMLKDGWDKAKTWSGRFDTVGCDRYFETMAFHACRDGKFWDADVEREISFESKWEWELPDMEQQANDGHYAVVKEIVDKLESGETFSGEGA